MCVLGGTVVECWTKMCGPLQKNNSENDYP